MTDITYIDKYHILKHV